MGRLGGGGRPLLGPPARKRADRRRHHGDAVAQVSARQLELGFPVGVRAAFAGHGRRPVVEGVFLLARRTRGCRLDRTRLRAHFPMARARDPRERPMTTVLAPRTEPLALYPPTVDPPPQPLPLRR